MRIKRLPAHDRSIPDFKSPRLRPAGVRSVHAGETGEELAAVPQASPKGQVQEECSEDHERQQQEAQASSSQEEVSEHG